MLIAQAAKRTGATPRAIRLYEQLGLIQIRRRGSYRVYSDDDIEFINYIRHGLQLGITLKQMAALVQANGQFAWPEVDRLLQQQQVNLQQKIIELQQLQQRISAHQKLMQECVLTLDSDL